LRYGENNPIKYSIELKNATVLFRNLSPGISTQIKRFSQRVRGYMHLRHIDFIGFFTIDIQLTFTAKWMSFNKIEF